MESKYIWVLFSYNGNNTVARTIHGATQEQLEFFMDSGGNQDDGESWCFEGREDCTLICVCNFSDEEPYWESVYNHRVMWTDSEGEIWRLLHELPKWIVDYTEYPDDGKIVRQVGTDTYQELTGEERGGVSDMEREAEEHMGDEDGGDESTDFISKSDIDGRSGF